MKNEMSRIASCNVTECSYNRHNSCHTMAITVGGPEACPQCDTYVHSASKGGVQDLKGGVGPARWPIAPTTPTWNAPPETSWSAYTTTTRIV